jgi:hypothetical protein
MDAPEIVVVRRGTRFETARVAKAGPAEVWLAGGWPEGGFADTATILVGESEIEARVLRSARGEVALAPLAATGWPADVRLALDALVD